MPKTLADPPLNTPFFVPVGRETFMFERHALTRAQALARKHGTKVHDVADYAPNGKRKRS